jgi:CxxC motif-containing protein (DUF1111 family)
MRHARVPCLLALIAAAACAAQPDAPQERTPRSDPVDFEGDSRPGGAITVADATATALGRTARNLRPAMWPRIMKGKRIFQRVWSSAPGPASGLGPLYNAASCAECHFRDGRGGPASPSEPDVRLLVRLADPVYGGQLGERAAGVPPEGTLSLTYRRQLGAMADGTLYALRRPVYAVTEPGWGAPIRSHGLSPRMPGALAGSGLLEAIPARDILSAVDPDDRDGDGISGRASWVSDARNGGRALGRFGWKAAQPSVEQQIATALREDMGLTSWLRPESSCTPAQPACAALDGAEEVPAHELDALTTYVSLLAVPAVRPLPEALREHGRQLFVRTGCAACHTPRHRTAVRASFPELEDQVIFPYTDLLLHDLGEGLADGLAESQASGSEWRTPPLWGLGLLPAIHGRVRLLHDGRARSVEEAILWHDGEARAARHRYAALPLVDRHALVSFVESL